MKTAKIPDTTRPELSLTPDTERTITVLPAVPLHTEAPDGALIREHHQGEVMNEAVRAGLLTLKKRMGWSNDKLGQMLGKADGTAINKYLNGRPEGKWLELQARAADLLDSYAGKDAKTAPKIVGAAGGLDALWKTAVSRQVNAAIETARATNGLAIVHGDAGVGKTCALAMYVAEHPHTALITASEDCKNAEQLKRALFAQERVPLPRGRHGKTREEVLADRFTGSDRLIVVDNGQRVSRSGLRWLFDFHDRTDCPVALVGNSEEILGKVSESDQLFSRVSMQQEAKLNVEQAEEMAREMVARAFPKLVATLEDLAAKEVIGDGHGRSLRQVLALMRQFLAAPGRAGDTLRADPRLAFAEAKKKRVQEKCSAMALARRRK